MDIAKLCSTSVYPLTHLPWAQGIKSSSYLGVAKDQIRFKIKYTLKGLSDSIKFNL